MKNDPTKTENTHTQKTPNKQKKNQKNKPKKNHNQETITSFDIFYKLYPKKSNESLLK